MSDKVFLDTNIFVYANDTNEPLKRDIALGIIREGILGSTGVISYQVVHEFFNVVLTKVRLKMPQADAERYLDNVFRRMIVVPSSLSLVSEAIRLQDRFRLSWYDSLIVAAAQHAGCSVLCSEDLQHGQQFGPLTVRDPFR
jgi:predicted nucleic acid-binding protein